MRLQTSTAFGGPAQPRRVEKRVVRRRATSRREERPIDPD